MKKNLLRGMIALSLFLLPQLARAQAPNLGTAANFVLLTTVGAVTNSGTAHLTHLTGHVGSNVGSSTGFGNVDGVMHDGDGTSGTASADLLLAYIQLNTATPTFFPSSALGGGATLVPGVYSIAAAATLSGDLILDGQGDPNALFIFQINGSLATAANSKVKLINGALACNVFWKVEGLVSMASGTFMRGTIVAHNAAINMSALDSLEGRALAINGAITTNSDLAYKPIGCGSAVLTGPAAPTFVASAPYAILSGIGPVANSGITYVGGDVGTNSGLTTGFNPLLVTGMIHPSPDASTASAAADLLIVYNYLNMLPIDIELLYPAQFGNDLVLTPHTYLLNAATMLTGSMYMNAQNNPNAVFVMHVNGAFSTSTLSKIGLRNGAQAKNIYWLINGAVHVFDNSLFNGNIVAAGAITLNPGDTLNGRAMTINGAINISGSYINMAPTPCVAAPITGTQQVCPGRTTQLSNADAGGTWTSSNTLIATVGSTSGLVSGMAAGIDTVTYTNLLGCVSTATITVNPAVSVITGPGTVCVGSSITLSSTSPGGTWTSTNTTMATVGSSSGIVNGVSVGTPTISYILSTGCAATKSITVNPSPNAGTITGLSVVCTGTSITLTNSTPGGVWTSSNTNATVLAGVVTGVAAGVADISYTVTNSCGSASAVHPIAITTSANAGTITGPSAVCTGNTITLTNTTPGGVWTSSNTNATVVAGVVTGVAAGITNISYTVTTSCGTASTTKSITVNPSPNAGTITGLFVVCTGTSITLTNTTPGGVWSSSNTNATVLAGVVTGVAAGLADISYTVTNSCGSASAVHPIAITTSANAGTITGPSAVCTGNTITLTNATPGGVWTSSNTNATVVAGVVTGVAAGITDISYTVTTSCGTAFTTKSITVNPSPNAGTITGLSVVCVGTSITLTNTTPGGVWTSSNTNATVVAGLVTGVAAGVADISYTVTNSCGSASAVHPIAITTSANAGTITGPSAVCTGSTITLTNTTPGGIWTSSNTNATVVAGVVTGVAAGITDISYTVTTSCGTAFTTKSITVNPSPNAGTINGLFVVCTGTPITLTNITPGGLWSSSNTNATVDAAGLVTGVAAGLADISYTVTNSCGSASAVHPITITTSADAGTITGPSAVCTGNTITLTNTTPGGIWTSSNTNATVVAGVVTGVAAGITDISYTVTTSCGTATTTQSITVNPSANAGTITGPSVVCAGAAISLTNATTGGIWTSSNTNATVDATGTVTGVAAGVADISYTVSNSCGSATTTQSVTITTTASAGTISGPSVVCVAATIALTDAATGGVWSTSNSNATVSAAGIVTGVAAGAVDIMYSVTNSCGTTMAMQAITVNPLPNAGTITGASSVVCVSASIAFTNTATGGVWSTSNTNAAVSAGGIVSGVAAGAVNIMYTVTNSCGTDVATQSITVNPLPNAGTITGTPVVCVGATTALTNVATGVWSTGNTNASVNATGIVTGVTAGAVVVSYTVINSCGTDVDTMAITVNPLPDAGVITGASSVCVGISITLTNSATGGIWTGSNANALVTNGVVIGVAAGSVNISYTVVNSCGTDIATKAITVNPQPNAGTITGSSNVCVASSVSLTNATSGGIWSSSNTNITVTTGGIVTAVTAATGTISYSVTNMCGTATAVKTITVNALPATPVISLGVSTICDMTYFRNFGAATLPPAGTRYTWSAVNAAISDTGSTTQYALVNFKNAGNASVVLTSSIISTGCKSSTSYAVTVGNSKADVPAQVIYFNHSFVCLQNNEEAYKWGYDDAATLAPTVLDAEMNQDYDNATPDFNGKKYWVMVTHNGCTQKAYYNKPQNAVEKIPVTDVTIYPNPASDNIQVDIKTNVEGSIEMQVFNMMGQKMYTADVTDMKASVNVAGFAPGMYTIICYRDGMKIATTRFAKN